MKKILITIGSILLTAAAITFSLVHWNHKMEMTTENAKEKIEVVKKTDPSLAGQTQEKAGGTNFSGNTANAGANNDSAKSAEKANDGDITVEAQGSSSAIPGTSLEEIKAAYKEVFTELEVQENSKVEQVTAQAKEDLASKKYSKDELIAKYQELAEYMEKNADKTFNAYYQQLQYNLEKYGYDVNEAVPFKNEYNTKKQERMANVLRELSQL